MTESPRQDERDDQPAVTPLRPLSALPVLQTLDLDAEDANGLVCAIDDPDCNPGYVPPASTPVTSKLGDEDDA